MLAFSAAGALASNAANGKRSETIKTESSFRMQVGYHKRLGLSRLIFICVRYDVFLVDADNSRKTLKSYYSYNREFDNQMENFL